MMKGIFVRFLLSAGAAWLFVFEPELVRPFFLFVERYIPWVPALGMVLIVCAMTDLELRRKRSGR